jgi:hypothetical protein
MRTLKKGDGEESVKSYSRIFSAHFYPLRAATVWIIEIDRR